MFLTHLSCTACGRRHEWSQLQNLCSACGKPLFANYDLAGAGRALTREALASREKTLWRYREVLPLPLDEEPVSLGEGGTPLLRAARFGASVGLANLWVKDEAQNPTQSFKARGHGGRRLDGETPGRDQTGRADRRQRRRRPRRLRRPRRSRGAYFHAKRHAARERNRVPRTWRARDS